MSDLEIYIDGLQANSALSSTYTGNVLNTDGPFEIAFGSGSDFIGSVDEVRLYPFEASASMVAQRFADTKDGLSSKSTINSADTSVEDQWRCQVTPNDGKVDGATSNTVTRTITTDNTVYLLTTNIVGSGSVIRNPDAASYVSGVIVGLNAVPASGWSFTGWNGDLTGSTNPISITMDSNKEVTATFSPIPPSTYTLTTSTIGNGAVIKNPNQNIYNSGAVVQLAASAESGYEFAGWSGDLTGTTNPTTITMDSNKAVTATFTEISSESHFFEDTFESNNLSTWDGFDGGASTSSVSPYAGTYHLSSNLYSGANNGWSGVYKSIAGTNPVYLSASVQFNAPPNTDNEDQWALCFSQNTAGNALAYAGVRQVSGTLYWTIWYISSGNTFNYQVSTTTYSSGWHNLKLGIYRGTSTDGWVELYIDGALTCSVHNLDNAARSLNYVRAGFSYSDAPASSSTTLYIDNLIVDSTPTTPTPTEHSLTVNVVGSGSVTKNPNQATYQDGQTVSLTASAGSSYQFTGWSGDLSGTTNPATITMNNDKTVTATFAPVQPSSYTLSTRHCR